LEQRFVLVDPLWLLDMQILLDFIQLFHDEIVLLLLCHFYDVKMMVQMEMYDHNDLVKQVQMVVMILFIEIVKKQIQIHQ
jgi:hypothetical protein